MKACESECPLQDPSSDSHQRIVSSTPLLKSASRKDQVCFLTTPLRGDSNNLLLSRWGLPNMVLAQYTKRGIVKMFEWQAECLRLPTVLSGGNLVYSAPTSAGKTLVAELLALKCVLELKRKVIIILPFVSVAHEKLNYLQSIFEPHGVKVGGFMGNQSPSGGFITVDIAICTIEKANGLVNHLLEERATHELGAVVVDEFHMIGDEHRGYLLELLLTKLIYMGKVGKNDPQSIQIIGMSATLPNICNLAKWLGAESYQTDYRPTPLHEMVKIGPMLYNTEFKEMRKFNQCDSIPGDEDDLLVLCRERILQGHSVLIFCPTKSWCETLASTIAEAQIRFLNCSNLSSGRGQGSDIIDRCGLVGVCEQLRRTQVGIDHVLERTIPHGIAFHHAGLTFEEREIVEGAFRQTLIKVLIATSTLSSGVNLPARLVIIRTPFFHRSLLDVLVYKQMVGRAGRKGVDELGESILMCKPSEKAKVIGLFKSVPKLIRSCLCLEMDSRAKNTSKSGLAVMKRAILETVASGIATTKEEVQLYATCTLHYAELEVEDRKDGVTILTQHLEATLAFLHQNDFISTRTKTNSNGVIGDELYPTQLGMATIASALSPDEALIVFRELGKARRNFVLENELHIIYLVS
jgi:DNA polymerase theta